MAKAAPRTIATLADLTPDASNVRRHNPRNLSMIESSLQRDGFGRSILLASDGTIVAGNATYEAAASAGIENVRVIDSDGTEVIAIRRTDVEPGSERFYGLALSDNRAAELASWDAEALQQVFDAGVDSAPFWYPEELDALLTKTPDIEFREYDESVEDEVKYCECPSCGHRFPK